MGYFNDNSRNDRDEDESRYRDRDYVGHIKGFHYTGHGTYTNDNGCSDLYVVKGEDGSIETYREM